jgi:hypothetical protein
MAILIVLKNPFTTIAPVHDMIDSAGILDAEFARHGTKVPKRFACVNSYDRPLFSHGIFLLALFRSEPGFVVLLDHANLLFHEAGHPLIGLFSVRLEPYGGTVGQLVFPVFFMVSFWRSGQAPGMAAASIWFFENWLNIGRYLADARAMELPLIGGGDHDWNTILSRWGLLRHDLQIAAAIKFVAWVGIATSVLWLSWRAWQDRNTGRLQAPQSERVFGGRSEKG